MNERKRDDGWRLTDAQWQQMEPLLPRPKAHQLGCHRPRVPNRAAMDAILLVLRTGMQWNALDQTAVCACSAAYADFGSGSMPACLRRSGNAVCLNVKNCDVSIGSGWRWTAA